MIRCSIGILAYNEEANIARLLEALRRQRCVVCAVESVIVVASGCTDRTEAFVREQMKEDERIRLLVQARREGKASAINLFLSEASGEVFVLISGDTIPEEETVERLVVPFLDPEVGMTGGRPVPVNREDSFMGFTTHLLWRLHHRIALQHPKLGEMIAFRSSVREIPPDTAVDEASIEAQVTAAGFRLRYVADAVVRNKGPENVKDFLRQRRRIAAGHLYLQRTRGYAVSTSSPRKILALLLGDVRWRPRELGWTAGAVLLEAWARLLGRYDYSVRKRNPFIWEIASSTKKLERVPR